MARYELQDLDGAGLAQGAASADMFFRLGVTYSTGRGVEPDLVSAHKWFNIAAARGHDGASRYRREIAEEMTGEEVAEALRAAREWFRLH